MQITEDDSTETLRHEQNDDVIINIIPPPPKLKNEENFEQDDEEEGRHVSSAEETEYSSASLSSSEDESSTNKNKNKIKNKNLEKISKNVNNNLSDLGYDSGGNSHDDDEDEDDDDCKILCKYDHDSMPNDLKILWEGANKDISIIFRDKKPEWFNIDKYRLGQSFAKKYYFCVNFAEMISLFMLFTVDLKALKFTNKSGTPFTAFKRYLSTVLRVKSWFDSDVFDCNSPAHNNIKIVRAMHQSVNKQMSSLSNKDIDNSIDKNHDRSRFTCPLKESVRDDFQNPSCPFVCVCGANQKKRFTQTSMSITQFGFVGLIVTFPEKLGVGTASDEELEGFIHLWKVVGYLLGIDDKYNFCSGTLPEVRQRSKHLIEHLFKPSFSIVDDDWEHYSRCVVKGISYYVPDITFEMAFSYLCYTLDIEATKIKSKISWITYFRVNLYKFMCHYLFKCQFVLDFLNRLLNISLSNAKKFSNEKLQKLEGLSNEYMHL